jgi:hypothetical protein
VVGACEQVNGTLCSVKYCSFLKFYGHLTSSQEVLSSMELEDALQINYK